MLPDIEFKEKIKKICGENNVLENESMAKHTTMKTGGNAALLSFPSSSEQVEELIYKCEKDTVPFEVIGKGSNIIVSDKGFSGVIICLSKNMTCFKKISDDVIYAEAGALLSAVSVFAADNNLSGMEFASGIPGSVGGAVIMNAGAYGGEIKDIFYMAEYLSRDKEGHYKIKKADINHGDFSYRTSSFKKNGDIVLNAEFRLNKVTEREPIYSKMRELGNKRISKQPVDMPSAGSAFKRPEGFFAGKLIEEAGLRGYSVGGAQVSDKHCGFIVNSGNATSKNVYDLVKYIQQRVFDNSGIMLESEIIFLGDY